MKQERFLLPEQISSEDWENTPINVKRFVNSLLEKVALSESERYLTRFLDATPIGIAVHSITGEVIYINNVGRSILGTNRHSEADPDRFAESFRIYRTGTQIPYSVEDLPYARALAGETNQISDLDIHRSDRTIPLEVTATPVFDDQGQVTFAIVTFQDITDRKRNEVERSQAESALKESELKLRSLTNAIPGAVYQFRLSADGGLSMIFMSQGIRDLAGISPEQAISDIQVILDLIVPKDLKSLHRSIAISAETLERWKLEFRIQTTRGKIKWIFGQSIPYRQEGGEIIWNGILTDITDRKCQEIENQQIEEALEQSETRFQNIAANVPGAIFRYVLRPDNSDAILYMSSGCSALWEVEAEAVLADTTVLWQMIDPEDVPALYASIMESAQNLQPWSLVWPITTPSGRKKWVESSAGIPERQANGDIIWDTLILDVTDRKQAEAALVKSEQRFRNLFELTPKIAVQGYNCDRQVIYWNDASEALYGYTKAEAMGRKLEDLLIPPENRKCVIAAVRNWIINGQTIPSNELELIHKDGSKVTVYSNHFMIQNSEGEREIYCLDIDLRDRKQAEIALKDSEERYRLLAENTNDLVCLHHPDGRYLYVSLSCETLLGYRYDEMMGKDPYTFFHPDDHDRIRYDVNEKVISGKPIPVTYRMRQKSGNYIWFETLTKSITDDTGRVIQLQTTSRDVTERIQVQTQLKYDALHDTLTGLPNRNLLMERLELAIHRAKRLENNHFAVLFLDLDRFKVINDSLGHLAGDKLLIAIAQKLQATFREIDLVARLGGDEFVVLLEDVNDIQEAIHATERIFTEFQTPTVIEEREVYTNASIGVVLATKDYDLASDLLRDADIAMYRAKTNGKARYEIFNAEMHKQALKRMHLENDLRRAIDCQEFVLHYQPIVALDTGYLVGFEALMRWQHPTQGLRYPGEFITVAEELGLITSLSYWALRTACQQLVTWQTAFPDLPVLKMSVNLSSQDLRRSDLVEEVDRILAQTHLQANCLTLEITESMLIEDIESTIEMLTQLKEKGIQISIDDFGTGYSSLNYLHRLPINNLKVDRSFVNQMEESKKNHRIVETIATLSQQLELDAIAEGIETLQQLEWLQQIGYKFGQGYLFSKPLSQDSAEELLGNTNLCLFA